MNTNSNWNTQPKTDTVAFSTLIAAGALMAWFAAAAPIGEISAAPGMTHAAVHPADTANDSRAVAAASHLTKING